MDRPYPMQISRPGRIPEAQFAACVIRGRVFVDALHVAKWLETLGRHEEAHYIAARAQGFQAAQAPPAPG